MSAIGAVEVATNDHYKAMDDQEKQARFEARGKAENAMKLLEKIDLMAETMMAGEEYFKEVRGYPVEYSLDKSEYHDAPEYPAIRAVFASKKSSPLEKLIAADELQSLMYQYCRDQAAMYLGIKKITDLEDAIRTYERDQ